MTPRHKRRRQGAAVLLASLALLGAGLGLYLRFRSPPAKAEDEAWPPLGAVQPLAVQPAPDPFRHLVFPTDRILDRNDPAAFQPTASSRPESALFGSVRMAVRGRGLAASFHEGIDIAAIRRDSSGRPQDAVYAVADGMVAYVNAVAGLSNYGKYIVLLHPCASGVVYTLYAHLAAISPGAKRGQVVKAGAVLGVVGNTANPPMPLTQAHLHFEVGLILNARLGRWFQARKMKNDHGAFNGWNLLGVDPLAVFESRRNRPEFDFFQHLAAVPTSFEVALTARRKPDFFDRYPCLWNGEPYRGTGLYVAVSEDGLPLGGRNATDEERRLLGGRPSAVLRVDPDGLGRNGCHLVMCRKGLWRLSREGEQWRDRLTYY